MIEIHKYKDVKIGNVLKREAQYKSKGANRLIIVKNIRRVGKRHKVMFEGKLLLGKTEERQTFGGIIYNNIHYPNRKLYILSKDEAVAEVL